MFPRSSLTWPIILGATLLALLVTLLVFWIVGNAIHQQWVLLSIGTVFFSLVLLGMVVYLIITIKEVRLNQRQANFIDAVTHELKSPIASIKLYLQTLDMRQVDQEQQREFHRFMLEDVQRLDTLIDELLEAARLTTRQRLEALQFELIPLVQQALEVIQRRYELPGDAIRLELQPCLVIGQPHDLEIVLVNLLDNAAKYGGSPRQILIQLAPKGDSRVVLKVSDNGRGVPHDLRRKIFRRFVRGGSELERSTQGTGLGLFLVKELVVRMKGRIQVHGRGPLGGATFEVELPGHALPLVPASESPAPSDVA